MLQEDDIAPEGEIASSTVLAHTYMMYWRDEAVSTPGVEYVWARCCNQRVVKRDHSCACRLR